MSAPQATHPRRRKSDRALVPGDATVRDSAQGWLIEAAPPRLAEPGRGAVAKSVATLLYGILTVAALGLTRWLADDLMWLLADLGLTRLLGSATVAGTLFLAAAAGASLALPLRPFLSPARWRRSVGALSCSAWLACGVWLLFGL